MWCFCGAPSPLLGRSRGSQTACSPTPPHPCRAPRPATSPPEPAVTRMCPHSPPMAAEEPESLVLQGLAACCRPASQPRACLGHPMTQFLCKHPQWVAGGRGAVGGGQRNGIQPGQVARFSLPCDCPKARGLGKLAGTRG